MNKTEVTRAKIDKWGKIVIAGLICLAVSPIIFSVVKGALGLLVAFVVGSTALAFTPWFTMKLANWKVKAIVAEAKENPIETLINLISEKKQAFRLFKENVTKAVAARETFKNKCDDFARKYPARAPEFQKQLENMTVNVSRLKKSLNDAESAIQQGEDKLEEMKAYWAMSEAAIEANKAAGMDIGDMYAKLKADTAVDAVFDNMNLAFAEMEVAASLQIENDPSPVFQGTTIDVQSKVAR